MSQTKNPPPAKELPPAQQPPDWLQALASAQKTARPKPRHAYKRRWGA